MELAPALLKRECCSGSWQGYREGKLAGETILVRQGKYAAAVPPGPWPGAIHTVPALAEVPALFT